MKSICFFCSYYTGNTLPAYVKFYLLEVRKHFSELVLVMNEKVVSSDDSAFINENNIILRRVVNEGYDFGMYHKMFAEYDVKKYDRVGLINDSCILFKKLDFIFEWIDKEKPDYCSITDNYDEGYHLQSYFLVINKNAIPLVINFFKTNGIITDFLEVIKVYELGLTAYLINAGMNVKAYYSFGKYEYGNPTWKHAKRLIKKGFPLIKKKIITGEYDYGTWRGLVMAGFDPYTQHYIKLIKRITRGLSRNDMFSDIMPRKGRWNSFLYAFNYIRLRLFGLLVAFVRKIKRGYKKLKRKKDIVS